MALSYFEQAAKKSAHANFFNHAPILTCILTPVESDKHQIRAAACHAANNTAGIRTSELLAQP